MSTTFEVYTPTTNIPTFNEVILLSNQYLLEFLTKHDIYDEYLIDVVINKNKTHKRVTFNKSNPATWEISEYAWFTVNKIPGGCDAYVDKIEQIDWERWDDEFMSNERSKKIESQMRKCLNVGYNWRFRRSAGQPAIINLSYGLMAAAFAKLVNGYIFSDDSAWDYSMFPTTHDVFLQNYFNPCYVNPDDADWARKNIEWIRNNE